MNLPFSRLQRVLDEPAVPFRMGDYLSRGFTFMNNNFGLLLAFTFLYFIINAIVNSIPVVGFLGALIVAPALQVGFYQFAYQVSRGFKPDFNDFFKGFTKLGPLVMTYLLLILVVLVILSPALYFFYQSGLLDWYKELFDQYPNIETIPDIRENVDLSQVLIGGLVATVMGAGIGILFVWSIPIAWFFNVTPMQALTASRKLASRYWLTLLIFLIVSGFVGVLGAVLCGVGLLYTIPAMICGQFFAFADVSRLMEAEDDGQASDPIDHFIA